MEIGTHEYRTRTIQEQFDALSNHLNLTQNVEGGMYPGIASLHHFTDTFYGDLISLNVSGEPNNIFTVRGVNTNQGPINIEWYVNAVEIATSTDRTIVGGAETVMPYLIASFSSHIKISGGRQISLVS